MRFHHLGVAVPAIASALPFYERMFGYRLQSGPFDDPIQKVTVCFLAAASSGTAGGPANDPVIELISPLSDDSPLRSILAQGGGAYHLCYEVPAIAAALEHAKAHGCLLLRAPVPAVAFAGRPIAWLMAPTRQLIELVEEPRRAPGG